MICRQVFARWDCMSIIESLLILITWILGRMMGCLDPKFGYTVVEKRHGWDTKWLMKIATSCGNCRSLLLLASFRCCEAYKTRLGTPFDHSFDRNIGFLSTKTLGDVLQAQQHNNDNSNNNNNNNNNNERKTRNKKMTNGFQFYMLHICMNSLIYYLKNYIVLYI